MTKEGDIVLCTVKNIVGTTVFVTIEGDGEGSIGTSEIAPGRIRNLRDYVVPGKKIVCKIIRIDSQGNVNLSLRRVTSKERNEVMEAFEKEKDSINIIRAVSKEKAPQITENIKKESSILEFLQACRDNPEKLKKYFTKEEADKICKILQERKDRKVEVKKEFILTSEASDGIIKIKSIIGKYQGINYLGAGRYTVKVSAEDYKKANTIMLKIIEEIEKNSKKEKAEFKLKEK